MTDTTSSVGDPAMTSTAGPVSGALLLFGVTTLVSAIPASIAREVLTTYWYIVGPLTLLVILWRYRSIRRSLPSVRPGIVVAIAAIILVATLGVGAVTMDIAAADTALGLSMLLCGVAVRSRFLIVTGAVTALFAATVGIAGLEPRAPLVAALSGTSLLVGGLLAVRAERRDPGAVRGEPR